MNLKDFLKNKRGSSKCNDCKINTSSRYINCYRDCTNFDLEHRNSQYFYKYVLNKKFRF